MPVRSAERPPFVLVHGAYHGGWCWRRVADRLTDRGGRVFSPSLTGLGDRSHLLRPDINLSLHALDIANLIVWEDLHDVMLCGLSYGGIVISAVAERIPERIHALVYLDALRPEPGTDLWQHISPEGQAWFEQATTDGVVAARSAEAFKVNPADRAWVDARCTPHPRATFHERLPDTNHRASIARKNYVYAAGYALPMLAAAADAATADPAWERIDLPHGHDLMIDAPQEVADILWDARPAPAAPEYQPLETVR